MPIWPGRPSTTREAAVRLLRSADFVCAHNAGFDRGHVERRLPEAAGLAWTCSCSEVDWRASGFDGRSLGWLLAQIGFFHGAHRAGDDVDAVIALLQHRLPADATALAEMLADANPKALGPIVERVTWHERHAPARRSGPAACTG